VEKIEDEEEEKKCQEQRFARVSAVQSL